MGGEELLLTCESQGGRPHAELQWRDAEGQRVFGHVQEHITRIGASSTFKTVSTLRFNPLHPMAVTCTAHSSSCLQRRQKGRGEVKSENRSSFSKQVNLACNTTNPLRLPLKNQPLLEISSRVFLKGRRIPTRLSTCG